MEKDFIGLINKTYRLLDCFPQGDPLKNKAKEKALRILESVSIISSKNLVSQDHQESAVIRLSADLEVLETYLELGHHQGWLSNINLLILKNEYIKLKSYMGSFHKVEALEKTPQLPQKAEQKPSMLPPNQNKLKEDRVKKEREVQKPIQLDQFSARQAIILKILNNREQAQVSDIIKEIPNITKRTLRRDLDDLLKKGKIVRAGEWNKISYKVGS